MGCRGALKFPQCKLTGDNQFDAVVAVAAAVVVVLLILLTNCSSSVDMMVNKLRLLS